MGEAETLGSAAERLRQIFTSLSHDLRAESANGDALCNAVVAAYASPTRRYHDLRHVESLLLALERFLGPPTQFPAAYWAAIYHDVVYEPLSPGNEAKSAEWAARDLNLLGAASQLIDEVRQMILATANHLDIEAEGDLAALLDCDLLILGSTPEEYDRYRHAIRAEYSAVPEDAYRFGRKIVLERFLDSPRIYRNPRIFAEYEEAARDNLEAEIAELG
jgi:predicted metal-dependent HD superfamily phosphohydrolase